MRECTELKIWLLDSIMQCLNWASHDDHFVEIMFPFFMTLKVMLIWTQEKKNHKENEKANSVFDS